MSESNGKVLKLQASRAPDGRARIVALVGDREVARDVCDLFNNDDCERVAEVIHRAVPAIELIKIRRELMLIDRENLPNPSGSIPGEWPVPESIDRPKMELFPIAALTEPLRSWVIEIARAYQVPVDLPALLGLAVCAGAVARRVEVQAGRSWIEPINLYVAVLLDPGNRKSAAFKAAFSPLEAIERDLIESSGPGIAKAMAERRMREAELKELEKKGSKGCANSAMQACMLAAELQAEPLLQMPKLIVDDSTAEAVEILLAAQGGRLVVAGCEGGLFDVMAGRYSSGMANLDCFLKGHAGDNLRVDRVSRSCVVERCCLTLAYAVQPAVLRGLADRPSFRGRGLIGRFIYAVPESPLGLRQVDPEPASPMVLAEYDKLIRRLFDAYQNVGDPKRLRLGKGAVVLFHDWQSQIERWLGEYGRLAELRDWGGKLAGQVARLAGILHLVQDDDTEPISEGCMESAIVIGQWAVEHAKAVIELMAGQSAPCDDAGYIRRWIIERALLSFSRRDVQNHGRARFDGDPDRLDAALELLVDRHWLRAIGAEFKGAGRPPSPRFAVNPNAANYPHNTLKSIVAMSEADSAYSADACVQTENGDRDQAVDRDRGVI
jgi:hypothetical protein